MKTNIVNNSCTIHGVALEMFGLGILIIGPSNIGKSELLLELISRGHKFIADDIIYLELNNSKLTLKQRKEPFIHIRGIGFVNIARIYGANSVIKEANLDIIIELTNLSNTNIDPIEANYQWTLFDQIAIKTFKLEVGKNRTLTVLIELLVKYEQNLINGYDSHQEFLLYHKTLLSEVSNAVNSN